MDRPLPQNPYRAAASGIPARFASLSSAVRAEPSCSSPILRRLLQSRVPRIPMAQRQPAPGYPGQPHPDPRSQSGQPSTPQILWQQQQRRSTGNMPLMQSQPSNVPQQFPGQIPQRSPTAPSSALQFQAHPQARMGQRPVQPSQSAYSAQQQVFTSQPDVNQPSSRQFANAAAHQAFLQKFNSMPEDKQRAYLLWRRASLQAKAGVLGSSPGAQIQGGTTHQPAYNFHAQYQHAVSHVRPSSTPPPYRAPQVAAPPSTPPPYRAPQVAAPQPDIMYGHGGNAPAMPAAPPVAVDVSSFYRTEYLCFFCQVSVGYSNPLLKLYRDHYSTHGRCAEDGKRMVEALKRTGQADLEDDADRNGQLILRTVCKHCKTPTPIDRPRFFQHIEYAHAELLGAPVALAVVQQPAQEAYVQPALVHRGDVAGVHHPPPNHLASAPPGMSTQIDSTATTRHVDVYKAGYQAGLANFEPPVVQPSVPQQAQRRSNHQQIAEAAYQNVLTARYDDGDLEIPAAPIALGSGLALEVVANLIPPQEFDQGSLCPDGVEMGPDGNLRLRGVVLEAQGQHRDVVDVVFTPSPSSPANQNPLNESYGHRERLADGRQAVLQAVRAPFCRNDAPTAPPTLAGQSAGSMTIPSAQLIASGDPGSGAPEAVKERHVDSAVVRTDGRPRAAPANASQSAEVVMLPPPLRRDGFREVSCDSDGETPGELPVVATQLVETSSGASTEASSDIVKEEPVEAEQPQIAAQEVLPATEVVLPSVPAIGAAPHKENSAPIIPPAKESASRKAQLAKDPFSKAQKSAFPRRRCLEELDDDVPQGPRRQDQPRIEIPDGTSKIVQPAAVRKWICKCGEMKDSQESYMEHWGRHTQQGERPTRQQLRFLCPRRGCGYRGIDRFDFARHVARHILLQHCYRMKAREMELIMKQELDSKPEHLGYL